MLYRADSLVVMISALHHVYIAEGPVFNPRFVQFFFWQFDLGNPFPVMEREK